MRTTNLSSVELGKLSKSVRTVRAGRGPGAGCRCHCGDIHSYSGVLQGCGIGGSVPNRLNVQCQSGVRVSFVT